MKTNRTHVLALIGALALLATVAVAASYQVTEMGRQQVKQDAHNASELMLGVLQLSAVISAEHSAIDGFLMSADPTARAAYYAGVGAEATAVRDIQARGAAYPSVLTELESVTESTTAWRTNYAAPAIAAVQRQDTVAIQRFASGAATDETSARSALRDLTEQVEAVEETIVARDEDLTTVRMIGTLIGLVIMLLAAIVAILAVRLYSRALDRVREELEADADRSGVLNRFTEVTTFAIDDTSVATSNLEALRLLVQPDAAVTHILNRSKDRATPDATLGSPIAEVLPLNTLSSCPGIVRGSVYVVDDAAEALSVHCPIYPVASGTLACVPLAHGETVGAVHLYWERPNAFPLELRASVARVAEHAALAIGNRRLVAALHGQATTDARTGLANSRAFDEAFEAALASRIGSETMGILMLDLDHFKDFNDRHGHPAGDEALKAFAGVLKSCLREDDLAARYGGEEFVVLLDGADDSLALTIAERIRSRTESTVISLAPGLTDRITVSIGVAMAPRQGTERVTLLKLADEALYHAKEEGRNRVRQFDGVAQGPKAMPSPKAVPSRRVAATKAS